MPILPSQSREQTIATHTEKVNSKRLAKQKNISQASALINILELAAKKLHLSSIEALAQWRIVEAARIESIQTEKRRQKLLTRQKKISASALSDDAWTGWFDGSAKPNPGDCQIGCLLKGPHGERYSHQQRIGYGSSSDAEYQALIATLALAQQYGITRLQLYGDSQVVINDVNKLHPKKSAILKNYRLQALALIDQFQDINIRWIPRHKNEEADALSQTLNKVANE